MQKLGSHILITLASAMISGCEKDPTDPVVDWLATLRNIAFVQVDRTALPGTENFLITDIEARSKLNSQSPENDVANAKEQVRERIVAIRDGFLPNAGDEVPLLQETSADDLASLAIPNVLTIDLSKAAGFPTNGRRLTDDVYDGFLRLTFDRNLTDAISSTLTPKADFPFMEVVESPAAE